MIYILHPQRDEKLGEIDRTEYWVDDHQHGLDGVHHMQFTTHADSQEAGMLVDRARLLRQASTGGWQEFVAYQITSRSSRTKHVIATGAEAELDRLKIIEPGTREGYTLEQYANEAIAGTGWQLGIVDYASFQTQTFDKHMGAYTFLRRVSEYFDRELRFRVEVSGNRIVGRFVDLVERVGADQREEIMAGENLIGIERKVFSDRIISALYCIGPEREDGTQLTVLVTDEDAFQRWNWHDQHIVDFYEPATEDSEMTLERLTTLGTTALKKRIDSVVEYEIEAVVLPNDDVHLGDTLRIKDEGFVPPLYAEARAVFVKEPISGEVTKKTYTIGEIKELKEEDVLRTFRDLQKRFGTRIIKSQTPPVAHRNIIWVKPDLKNPEKPDVPRLFSEKINDWKKISPTDAAEIGGLVVGEQYNGVSITPEEGLVVDRTDNLVRTIINATEGISIESRSDAVDAFEKMFFVNEFGRLILRGDLEAAGGTFAGALSSGDGANQITIDGGRVLNESGRVLFGVNSVLPEMFDKNELGFVYGKIYTHKLTVPVAPADYSPGDYIEVSVPITEPTSVAIMQVLSVSMQSESKEWYAYERPDGRTFTGGDLETIKVRISPQYAYTSVGTTATVNVMIVGTR